MKRNALVRIIIWSIVIVFLSGILWLVLPSKSSSRRLFWNFVDDSFHRAEHPVETEAAIPLETWVSADTLDGKNTFSAADISELKIEWVSGDILIQPGSTDQIIVKEDGVSDAKYAMVLKHVGKTLKITFCDESVDRIIGFGAANELSKDLTILVPPYWDCDALHIECASAAVEINDMSIQEVEFDGASGTCEFENCTVNEMDVDTASGDVRFIGSLNMLDCDAASASVYAALANTPKRLDIDSMSGDLELILPENSGFTLSINAMSSDFTSDFDTRFINENYVCGDGSCRINVDALSGDVMIRKADNTITEH